MLTKEYSINPNPSLIRCTELAREVSIEQSFASGSSRANHSWPLFSSTQLNETDERIYSWFRRKRLSESKGKKGTTSSPMPSVTLSSSPNSMTVLKNAPTPPQAQPVATQQPSKTNTNTNTPPQTTPPRKGQPSTTTKKKVLTKETSARLDAALKDFLKATATMDDAKKIRELRNEKIAEMAAAVGESEARVRNFFYNNKKKVENILASGSKAFITNSPSANSATSATSSSPYSYQPLPNQEHHYGIPRNFVIELCKKNFETYQRLMKEAALALQDDVR